MTLDKILSAPLFNALMAALCFYYAGVQHEYIIGLVAFVLGIEFEHALANGWRKQTWKWIFSVWDHYDAWKAKKD